MHSNDLEQYLDIENADISLDLFAAALAVEHITLLIGGHADCCGKIKVENLNNKCPGSGKEKARSEERKCIFQRIRRKGSRKTQQISLKQPGSASCLFLHLSLVLSYYETGMRGK